MSFDKPSSVRQFLMNVPPPSKSVQDEHILDEMNKLYRQKLVQKASVQTQPKPTTAQIIRRNSLKESEKRKAASEIGPLSEIDPASDRFAASVKKFKKPSCRFPAASPSASTPNATSSAAAPNESAKVSRILTQGLMRRGSSEPKKSPEKSKITPIDDILDSIFQSAEKAKPSPQSNTPPSLNSSSSKSASPLPHVNPPPKPKSPAQSVSISSTAVPPYHPPVNSTFNPSTVQQPSALPLHAMPPTINKSLAALPQPMPPKTPSLTNVVHAARPVAPWATVKQSPVHSQASVATNSQVLPPIGVPPLPSPPLSAQQSSGSPALPPPSAGQALPPQDKPKKISKNQKKKLRQAAKKAANAAKQHVDNRSFHPNNLEDTDFDTLLQMHEKSASTKPSDQQNGKHSEQNKNKKDKKKNKAANPQMNLNQNQHTKDQAAKTANAVHHHTGAFPHLGHGQPANQASHQQQQFTEPLPATATLPHNNSGKATLEDIARQITGAPRPLKRPNDNNANQQNKRQKTKKEFVPLVTCRYFANGHCSNGDACTFKHDKDAVVVQENPKKKIVCEFFKTGSCCKFDACPFSHDLKLEPCRFFHLKDNCKEANCPYSHDPLNDDMLAKLRKLTGPCRFYHFKGVCNQGDRCPFSHDEVDKAELEKLESTIHLCTFFHLDGACAKGDDCFYQHQEASPEKIAELKANNKKKGNHTSL